MNFTFTLYGVIMATLGIGLLIFLHELGHFLAAKYIGVGVTEFSLGFGKKIFGIKKGETEYKMCLFPLGGYVTLMGLETPTTNPEKDFMNKTKFQRLVIISAGVLSNLFIAVFIIIFVFMATPQEYLRPVVVPINAPAINVLQKGDEITEIDGMKITRWEDFSKVLSRFQGGEISLAIIRQGQEKTVKLSPILVDDENIYGEKIMRYMIGIKSADSWQKLDNLTFFEATSRSIKECLWVTEITYECIKKLILGTANAEKTLGGPVFMFALMSTTANLDFLTYIHLFAVLSLALAIMNSLPIPALDGGHMMFILYEAIIGKPVKDKTVRFLSRVFLCLLYGFMVWITVFIDIKRLL